MSKQSQFHACATFVVKVSRGCTFWQVGNQLCRDTHPLDFFSVDPSIKCFSRYADETSMCNQSQFSACDSFTVRVMLGVHITGNGTQGMPCNAPHLHHFVPLTSLLVLLTACNWCQDMYEFDKSDNR